ncbi:MAG: sarcosine oxidase [Methylobacterium mesophilicum]|nr:sarcosine oxidase [Methylobacterium mesophilicum]
MLQERHHLSAARPLDVGRLSVRLAPDRDRFSFRIDPALADAAGRALGLDLSGPIGTVSGRDERCALRLGPDEWFLLMPSETGGEGEKRLARALPDAAWSLVDVSHREVGIEVSGPAAALALRSFVAFDLDAMPANSGCRTIFDRAQIILFRETPDRFRIEVWQSFASHVWALLDAASREIALDI